MLMCSFIIQIYFFTLLYSLAICVFLLLIKYTILEQIANIADGQFPYSTEKLIKNILSFMMNSSELKFFITSFICLIIAMFIMIYFIIPRETINEILHEQILYLFDFVILFILTYFCVWKLKQAETTMDFIITYITIGVIMIGFSVLYAIDKPQNKL
jgi:hypothetical protein